MKGFKIAIYPGNTDPNNSYINRMVEAINLALPNATICPFPRTFNIKHFKKFDYIWFNWFENLAHKYKFRGFIKKIGLLVVLKLLRVKTIATLHNRMPHDSDGSIWDRLTFNTIFRLVDTILILSSDSKKFLIEEYGTKITKKVKFVPHPTYDCIPKKNTGNKTFKILFFGNLRPYKNIELIFELAKSYEDIQFTIAGNANDKEYEETLIKTATSIPNITIISHFLTPAEVDSLINDNSILLLPYNTKSSLNSGVVIHAICMKINIIVPQIGTVNEIRNKDMIFSYTYDSTESHLRELNRMIQCAREEYENAIDKFDNRINVLYEEIVARQSPEALIPLVRNVFC